MVSWGIEKYLEKCLLSCGESKYYISMFLAHLDSSLSFDSKFQQTVETRT